MGVPRDARARSLIVLIAPGNASATLLAGFQLFRPHRVWDIKTSIWIGTNLLFFSFRNVCSAAAPQMLRESSGCSHPLVRIRLLFLPWAMAGQRMETFYSTSILQFELGGGAESFCVSCSKWTPGRNVVTRTAVSTSAN